MPTFNDLETSRYSRPVDLYRFKYGAETFYFTSAAEEVIFGGATYTPLEMKRTEPSMDPSSKKGTRIKVDTLATQRPFKDFIGIQPALQLECLITRTQTEETTLIGFVIFEGYVTSIAFSGRKCSLDLNPHTEAFAREIPRYKYHGLCNNVLYDSQCSVDRNLFDQSGVVNGIAGNTISVGGFSGTAFTGGYVQNQAGNDYRMIIEHSADVFTLLLPFRSILNETVTAFQGCDHTVTVCRDKFNNVSNFSGYPLIPGINPFSQSSFTKS